MKIPRWLKALLGAGSVLVLLLAGFLWFEFGFVHQHCIVAPSIALQVYADEHGGRYPENPRGFGDALLDFIKTDYATPMQLVAPGDDGHFFTEALATGSHVDENLCTRVYVMGLNKQSDRGIALLFDRYGCPGGDHFRSHWGPKLREVVLAGGGGMVQVPDSQWPAFARRQVKLLAKAGLPMKTAQYYYLMTGLSLADLRD